MADRDRNDPEPLWTVEKVAEYLGLHPQTVYAKALCGEIPSLKVGRGRRFRRAEIEAWLEQNSRPVAEGIA